MGIFGSAPKLRLPADLAPGPGVPRGSGTSTQVRQEQAAAWEAEGAGRKVPEKKARNHRLSPRDRSCRLPPASVWHVFLAPERADCKRLQVSWGFVQGLGPWTLFLPIKSGHRGPHCTPQGGGGS